MATKWAAVCWPVAILEMGLAIRLNFSFFQIVKLMFIPVYR
jgi:hypothetical protein